jgi:hypothetical protein
VEPPPDAAVGGGGAPRRRWGTWQYQISGEIDGAPGLLWFVDSNLPEVFKAGENPDPAEIEARGAGCLTWSWEEHTYTATLSYLFCHCTTHVNLCGHICIIYICIQ